jgi:hypothetical protein
MPLSANITFYPEVLYRSMKIVPERWHRDSIEPLVFCRLMGNEISKATSISGGPKALKQAVEYNDKEAEARWRSIGVANAAAFDKLRHELVEEGWEDHGMDGLVRYLHVDNIEKMAGPPPEGPF